jgi:RimJ/RimL family protein N-acetyltransferase
MQFIYKGVLPLALARHLAYSSAKLAPWSVHLHRWLVERREDQARLGWFELSKFRQGHRRKDGSDDVQIGFEFAPPYWKAGYAAEAGLVVVEHAFAFLELDRLVAFARPENHRSVRVLTQLGFQQDGYCRDDGRHRGGFYILTREEWQARTPVPITTL